MYMYVRGCVVLNVVFDFFDVHVCRVDHECSLRVEHFKLLFSSGCTDRNSSAATAVTTATIANVSFQRGWW